MIRGLIVCLSIIGLLSSAVFAKQNIQLGSDIVNGHFVPVIKINGKKVMTIQDKGSGRQFISTFDRAEYIYSMLVDLDSKGVDLSTIRVKRSKSDYLGEVKKHRIFKVSKGDRLSQGVTSYQVAKKWVEAIQSATFIPNQDKSELIIDRDTFMDKETVTSASTGFRLFQHRRKFVLWLQIAFIGLFQMVIVFAVVHILDKRRGYKFQRVYDRIETIQRNASELKRDLHDVRTTLNKVTKTSTKSSRVKSFPKSGT